MGVYRLGYYPHNVHFVLASAQMAGDGPTVIAAAEKLRGLIPDEVAAQHRAGAAGQGGAFFAHALFSPSATVLALPDPGDAIPYVKAMWHYARGIADAAQGDFTAAKAEANAIVALEGGDFTLLKSSGVPAQDVLALAALSSKPASRSVRATRLQRSSGSSGRLRCRTGCPTWSRRTGITRCGSRSRSR